MNYSWAFWLLILGSHLLVFGMGFGWGFWKGLRG